MQRVTNEIRDLEPIESELKHTSVGVLALYIDDEKTIQYPTTFLYRDKNIYIFFKNSDELYESIKYNSSASFTVIREEKSKKIKRKVETILQQSEPTESNLQVKHISTIGLLIKDHTHTDY